MAGHSHSSNIKHRKERNDNARSQLFLKLRKQIENSIRNEGKVTEKILSLAQKNGFSKEKVFQIEEQIKKNINLNKEKNFFLEDKFFFFEGLYNVLVWWKKEDIKKEEQIEEKLFELEMKAISKEKISNFFEIFFLFKINKQQQKEELLLEIMETISHSIEFQEKEDFFVILTREKNVFNSIKELFKKKKIFFLEDSYFSALFKKSLIKEEKEYLEKILKLEFLYKQIKTNVDHGIWID